MENREILKRAARQMILDNLLDAGEPLDNASDATLARIFDEVNAVPKTAAANPPPAPSEPDPTTMFLVKAAEHAILGRMAARAFVLQKMRGAEKIAQGLSGLADKITGLPYKERMARQRGEREMELELGPPEVALRDIGQAQGTGQDLRRLGFAEATQRQEMANQLRQLQLADQFARREREKEMFRRLYPSTTGSAARGAMGGLAAGLAGRGLLTGAAGSAGALAGMSPTLARAIASPLARKLPIAGLLTGAALGTAFGRKGPSRVLTRTEKEMMTPSTMLSDVQP
jgi:hypothetical protein